MQIKAVAPVVYATPASEILRFNTDYAAIRHAGKEKAIQENVRKPIRAEISTAFSL